MCLCSEQNDKICDGEPFLEDCQNDPLVSNATTLLLIIGHAMLGLGGSVYWTCGYAYMDDNVRKNSMPVLLGECCDLYKPTMVKYHYFWFHWTIRGRVKKISIIKNMSTRYGLTSRISFKQYAVNA